MTPITFIVNELTVTNTPSLKRREAGRIDMGFERALYPLIVGLEAYPNGTHFKVTVEAIEVTNEKEIIDHNEKIPGEWSKTFMNE